MLASVTKAAEDQDRSRRYELVIARDNCASVRVAETCGYRVIGMRRSSVEATGQTYEDIVYVPAWSEISA